MLTIEKLKGYGADVEDGLARCMDMEDFYISLVAKVLEDIAGAANRRRRA